MYYDELKKSPILGAKNSICDIKQVQQLQSLCQMNDVHKH